MFCTKCGTEISDGAKFCANCGNRVDSAPTPGGEIVTGSSPQKGLIIAVSVVATLLVLVVVFAILVLTGVIGGGNHDPENIVSDSYASQSGGDGNNNLIPSTTTETPEETAPPSTPTPEPTLSPEEISYQKGKSYIKKKQYIKAATVFKSLGSYKNSRELYKKSRYLLAKHYMRKRKYEKAKSIFQSLHNYKNAKRNKELCIIRIFTSKRVNIAQWYEYPPDPFADGFKIESKWNAVNGADGYEVSIHYGWYNFGEPGEVRSYTETQKQLSYSFQASGGDVNHVEIKVRAFKSTHHGKVYTSWSQTRVWTL